MWRPACPVLIRSATLPLLRSGARSLWRSAPLALGHFSLWPLHRSASRYTRALRDWASPCSAHSNTRLLRPPTRDSLSSCLSVCLCVSARPLPTGVVTPRRLVSRLLQCPDTVPLGLSLRLGCSVALPLGHYAARELHYHSSSVLGLSDVLLLWRGACPVIRCLSTAMFKIPRTRSLCQAAALVDGAI